MQHRIIRWIIGVLILLIVAIPSTIYADEILQVVQNLFTALVDGIFQDY